MSSANSDNICVTNNATHSFCRTNIANVANFVHTQNKFVGVVALERETALRIDMERLAYVYQHIVDK